MLATSLASRNPGWRVVGADVREDLLEQGRRRASRDGVSNVEFVRASLTEDLGLAIYDAVAAVECLEEIHDDEQALRMMANALRGGGLFVVQVPEHGWRPVLRGSEQTWRDEVRHGYTAERFTEQLTQAGFEPVRTEATCRSLVGLAQEIRDRIKNAPVSVRTLSRTALDPRRRPRAARGDVGRGARALRRRDAAGARVTAGPVGRSLRGRPSGATRRRPAGPCLVVPRARVRSPPP